MQKEEKTLSFSFNWNRKLDNNCFSTLRLTARFEVGDEIEIIRPKNEGVFRGIVRTKQRYAIAQLDDSICYLDTGYDRETTLKILANIYKNQPITEIFRYIIERLPNKTEVRATQTKLF